MRAPCVFVSLYLLKKMRGAAEVVAQVINGGNKSEEDY
jgi:hypothetical protein